MDVSTALQRLQSCGFSLTAENNALIVEPASKLSDTQREWIRQHKAALLKALTAANDEPIRVEVWTPSGVMMTVTADSPEHAEWLRRMNPPTNAGPVRSESVSKDGAASHPQRNNLQ